MPTLHHSIFAALLVWLGALSTAVAEPSPSLEEIVQQRLSDDLSGACLAVARITDVVETVFHCSDPERVRELDEDSRFEIASISKALQGILLARLVEQDKLALDEALVDVLPRAEAALGDAGRAITLGHLLTHVSGLERFPNSLVWGGQAANPYAHLDAERVLEVLAGQSLHAQPGESYSYSNLGAMLLSMALLERTGRPFDELLAGEILIPLGLHQTSIDGPTVPGHNALGQPVLAWDFPAEIAGVGGLRASLADLIRLTQALLAAPAGDLGSALARSQETLRETPRPAMAWGWFIRRHNERRILWHNGETSGFSSALVFDPEAGIGAVVLSDTDFGFRGGVSDLAFHLIDPSLPLRSSR